MVCINFHEVSLARKQSGGANELQKALLAEHDEIQRVRMKPPKVNFLSFLSR